jgi:two-component hybrid sensor and regulator
MNTTISGKMQYLDDLKILMLNNLPYNDCSDFHIKKTDELINVIKEHKPYINKITFYLVSSYNSGEASFLYDNDDIYFVIFNVESSLESTYLKKGNSMIYNIKAKQLNFKTIEEEQFFIDKYPHNYDLKTHILDEIDMLMLRNINEIYFKHTLVDKEEESHVLEVKGNYISNNQITINIYDVTKEEALISKAFQAEKLQALGNMSGAIAHELNNQLMAIDGNIELCYKSLKIKENSYLTKALEASSNASNLIKSLLSYSVKDDISFEKIYIDDLFKDIDNKINLSVIKDVDFIKNVRDDMARVYIYGSKLLLVEAFGNIITNAIESFNKTDHILIMNSKVTYLNTCPKDAINYQNHISGKFLQIDFIDNGCGIPYELYNRIFDPFFTTKDKFSRSGLGLTQALGTIIKHSGILTLKSAINNGTTISVYLPCKEEKMQMSFDLFVNKTKILVIDDDEIVRQVLEMLLKDLGYEVISSSDPYEAISIFDLNKDSIDLVISDMIMPKLNGKELFYRLKEIKKNLRFILLSGYTKNNVDEKFLNDIDLFLEKPIRKDVLEKEIKKCLK